MQDRRQGLQFQGTCVHGNGRGTTILMTKTVMTTAGADNGEARPLQLPQNFGGGHSWKTMPRPD